MHCKFVYGVSVCQCNMLLKCVGLLFSAGDNASK